MSDGTSRTRQSGRETLSRGGKDRLKGGGVEQGGKGGVGLGPTGNRTDKLRKGGSSRSSSERRKSLLTLGGPSGLIEGRTGRVLWKSETENGGRRGRGVEFR